MKDEPARTPVQTTGKGDGCVMIGTVSKGGSPRPIGLGKQGCKESPTVNHLEQHLLTPDGGHGDAAQTPSPTFEDLVADVVDYSSRFGPYADVDCSNHYRHLIASVVQRWGSFTCKAESARRVVSTETRIA